MSSPGFHRIRANLVWLAADRGLRLVVNVVVLGLVARHLGPEQFGWMNYAVGLAGIFAPVATLGMDGIVIRELVANPRRSATTLGTAFVLRLAGGLGAVGLVVVAAWWTRDGAVIAPLALVAALVFLPQSLDVIDLWFQRQVQSKFTVLARAVALLVGAGLKIALVVYWRAPVVAFCGALVADAVLGAVALVWMYGRRGERIFDWRVSRAAAVNLLRQSWPLILSGLLVAGYLRVEQLLVMERLGSRSAGIYYAAVRITEIWLFVPGLILSSSYPLLLEKRVHDRAGYEAWLQRLFDGLTGLGYVVALGAGLLGPWVIRWLYGAEYADAAVILMILGLAAPVIFSGSVRAQYFMLENLNLYHTWSALVGIAVNVGLAWWLMTVWGAAGAATGAVAGYLVSAVGTSLVFPALRRCGGLQVRALLLPLRPGAVREYWRQYREA